MDPISHRREGDLPWEWLGDNPLSLNSAEFRNLHRCKLSRAPICLHNPDIELESGTCASCNSDLISNYDVRIIVCILIM